MAALTAARDTPRMGDSQYIDFNEYKMAASTTFYAGGLVMLESGYVKPAAASAVVGAHVIGVAEESKANAGSAGAAVIRVRHGVHKLGNAASGDAVAQAQVGALCYAHDDQTVGKLREATAVVKTLTPTAANDTKYQLAFFAGGRFWHFATTSDASGTATEICDAFRVLFAADTAFTALLVCTGTATMILTGQAGSGIGADFDVASIGIGAIAVAATTAGVVRPPAGRVMQLDSDGVWVRSGPALSNHSSNIPAY